MCGLPGALLALTPAQPLSPGTGTGVLQETRGGPEQEAEEGPRAADAKSSTRAEGRAEDDGSAQGGWGRGPSWRKGCVNQALQDEWDSPLGT